MEYEMCLLKTNKLLCLGVAVKLKGRQSSSRVRI